MQAELIDLYRSHNLLPHSHKESFVLDLLCKLIYLGIPYTKVHSSGVSHQTLLPLDFEVKWGSKSLG